MKIELRLDNDLSTDEKYKKWPEHNEPEHVVQRSDKCNSAAVAWAKGVLFVRISHATISILSHLFLLNYLFAFDKKENAPKESSRREEDSPGSS